MKRILSSLIIIVMLFGIFPVGSVYAADVRMSINWFERSFEEVVVVSLNIKTTENNRYGLEFSAPANENAQQDLNQKQAGGMLAIANGEISAKPDGTWIQNGQELADGNVTAGFSLGEMHNVKLQHTRRNGNVKIYVDNVYMGEYNLKAPPTSPMNCVTVIADSTITSGIELDVVSVTGAREGAMSAAIREHNAKDKTIDVVLSEKIAKSGYADEVVLKSTNTANGEKTIPLSANQISDEEIVFTYRGELEKATEYALIFPEGLTGILGGELVERFCYFTTDADVTVDRTELCNYNDGRATVWLSAVPQNISLIADTGDENIKAFNVAAFNEAGFQSIWRDMKIPGENHYAVSFDIKPMQASLKMGIEFRPTSGNPVSVAFGKSGYILGMNEWTNDGWLNINNIEGSWANANKIANYNTSDWINFKAEFNGSNMTLFINGKEAYTKSGFGTLGEMAFHSPGGTGHAAGTSLMLLDNIATEKIYQLPTIEKTRFIDTDGNEVGAFDVTDRIIDKIELYFSSDMNPDTLNVNNVHLTYNNSETDYSGSYDEQRMCYDIKPSKLAPSEGKVVLSVTGAADANGEEMQNFSAVVYADKGDDELSADTLRMVNADGSDFAQTGGMAYVKSLIANADTRTRNITISLMGYKKGALARFDTADVSVNSQEKYETDIDVNSVSIDTAGLDKVILSVCDRDTGCPLAEAVAAGWDDGEVEYVIKEDTGLADGAWVNAEIYAPGKSFSDIAAAEDFRDALVFKTQITADEKGCISSGFNIDYEDAVSGMYKVCLSADGYSHTYEILYANPLRTKELTGGAFGDAIEAENSAELAEIIKDEHYDLGADAEYINDETCGDAAELLIEYYGNRSLSAENISLALNKALVIAAVNTDDVDDILAEAERLSLDNSSLADLYDESFVTQTVADNVTERMNKKVYKKIDDFYDELYDAFVLAVVENPAKPNSIRTVLDAFDIDASDSDCIRISGKDYASISELKAALKGSSGGNSGSTPSHSGGSPGGGGGGGRVSVANNPTATEPENPVNTEAPAFDDMDDAKWAEEAVNALAADKIVNGKGNRSFCPMDNVTREEFTKMLSAAFGIRESGEEPVFDDVTDGAWYEPYIMGAYRAGIVKGYSESVFGVGENITREDMAVMLCRAAAYSGISLEAAKGQDVFADDNEISDYARDSVYVMKSSGVISGRENNIFAPADFATRAEAAKMIYGVYRR